MKIYFIRHGHPDYQADSLTATGKLQAEAAAKKLSNYGIERIFSSSLGRAVETAMPLAKLLSLEIEKCDFMREIWWGPINEGEALLANGHPWDAVNALVSMGESVRHDDWRKREPFSKSKIVEQVNRVENGVDAWLEKLGYKREGEHYRVIGDHTDTTVAMFSHAGSSTAALAHILGLPFPLACSIFSVDFTSITAIKFENTKGKLIKPIIKLLNDHEHIQDINL